ncbi:hypothetical protein ES705_40172 [subsurface metagenome]
MYVESPHLQITSISLSSSSLTSRALSKTNLAISGLSSTGPATEMRIPICFGAFCNISVCSAVSKASYTPSTTSSWSMVGCVNRVTAIIWFTPCRNNLSMPAMILSVSGGYSANASATGTPNFTSFISSLTTFTRSSPFEP